MISASDLISKFRYALDNGWGYIWGTCGVLWTQAKQNALNKTTDSNRKMSRLYGKKWIGCYVADCSGMFVWAFKQFGYEMSHISSNIYISYCNNKGKLTADQKKLLRPGTAVFTGESAGKHPHVGLFVGNGRVIEAKGTINGVVESSIDEKRWTWYGELKNVDYGGDIPVPEGYAVVTGTRVALRKDPSAQSSVLTRIDTGKQVKLEDPPPSEWDYVEYQGKKGYMMKKYLKEG